MMSSDSTPLSSNSSNQSVVITFPTDPTEVVSKEEIGKWVDLLMEMPEPRNSVLISSTRDLSNSMIPCAVLQKKFFQKKI